MARLEHLLLDPQGYFDANAPPPAGLKADSRKGQLVKVLLRSSQIGQEISILKSSEMPDQPELAADLAVCRSRLINWLGLDVALDLAQLEDPFVETKRDGSAEKLLDLAGDLVADANGSLATFICEMEEGRIGNLGLVAKAAETLDEGAQFMAGYYRQDLVTLHILRLGQLSSHYLQSQ